MPNWTFEFIMVVLLALGAARPPAGAAGYRCPSCGAALADAAEVSPLGDVKCTYCRKWFNIHRNEK